MEQFIRSLRSFAKSVWSWCITEAHDFSNSICVRLSRSKYWKIRRYLEHFYSCKVSKLGRGWGTIIFPRKSIEVEEFCGVAPAPLLDKIMSPTEGSYQTYFESTSCVKNNCKGQSTEYSRAIPSQPSSDISAASDSGPESPSVEAFAFGKSNWEDLTEIPKAGILVMVDREVSLCSSLQKSTDWITEPVEVVWG